MNYLNILFCVFFIVMVSSNNINNNNNKIAAEVCCDKRGLSNWQDTWSLFNPARATTATWSVQTRIPMTEEFDDLGRQERGKFKVKKKFKKFLLPLLLAYKLKFFTLIPVLIGGLVLLTGATGLAGFFFALFAAVMGLKGGGGH